ncbi:prepilin-type N-terminal cleavage/methylation domain-containing protein [bacterium]|nr:prepilin-type N-terminal cleavage/methylation domain-containing protein [bacterium]
MRPSRPRNRGFSLIELMFSMAIGSVLLILAATMLGSSGDGYERVGGSVASEREARALISQLASDLASARFHKDSVIEKSAASWPTDRLGFLSLQPAAAQTDAGRIGDLCAVNYYIKDLPIGNKTVRCLMRGFRESKVTFDAVKAGAVAPLFIDQPDIDEPIAFGVVSFEARPRSRDAAGKWIDWVKDNPNDTTGPEALDIKLVLARRELSGKLKQAGDWNGTGNAGKLLGSPSQPDRNKNLEVYGTTLRFGNHAAL